MAKTAKRELRQALRQRLSKSERAIGKLEAVWMRKSGLDTKALAALQKERQREVERFVKEERAEAARQARIPHAVVKSQAEALQALAESGFFTIPTVTLDKPTHITGRPGKILKSSRIKPFDSFAKVLTNRKQEGLDRLIFLFEWTNRSTTPVAIDAVTSLAASGLLDLTVSGGARLHWGFLTMSAKIALGPSPGERIDYETKELGGVMTVNAPLIPDGHELQGINFSLNLTALHHPVGPLQKVFIQVSVIFDSDCGSDFHSIADFNSGFLGVSCPLVVLRVHQKPLVSTPD